MNTTYPRDKRLRKYLGRVVVLMCAVLVLSFITILLQGTLLQTAPDLSKQRESEQSDYGLQLGQTAMRRLNGELVWISYLSTEQLADLDELTSHVTDSVGCDRTQNYCLLAAATERTGVQLQYTKKPPAQLPSDVPWVGGFVNPANSIVYDLLGRAYRFQGKVDSLVVLADS